MSWCGFLEHKVADAERASQAEVHWARRMLLKSLGAWVQKAQTGRMQQQRAAAICARIMRRAQVGTHTRSCCDIEFHRCLHCRLRHSDRLVHTQRN